MAATVFLPTFLIISRIQVLLLIGDPFRFPNEIAEGVYMYILFMLPLMLASLVYSAALLLFRFCWTFVPRRLAALVLAPLLPLTVYLFNLPGGLIYGPFFIPTVIAMILFGITARIPQIDEKPTDMQHI